ncbi:MAG TPA: ABC transporter ATP-binding protein [Clostridia bacterium]|nr:ABC transporter ATP-binding protein [Clostridia bacterium]
MTQAVEIRGLSKTFGRTRALQDVNMALESNKIFGLLGRNGAGKSTLIKLITGQLFPTGGEIKVFGEAPYENAKVLSQICVIRENGTFLKDMKAKDALSIAAAYYPNWDQSLADRMVKHFKLDLRKCYKSLSLGMKSQLGIIVGLASRAPLTIFDEPYIGLDAPGRQLFYDLLLEEYMAYPRTFILATHLIDEVANLFEEVIILAGGSVRLQDETDRIKEQSFFISGPAPEVERRVAGKKVIYRHTLGKTLVVGIYDRLSPGEIQDLKAAGLEVDAMPLQKLFIYLTEERGDGDV